GKIILHSSHDLGVVEKVCSRVIVLHKGRVVADDSVAHLGALMKLPNLEAIFSELTHQADPSAAAEDLAALMEQSRWRGTPLQSMRGCFNSSSDLSSSATCSPPAAIPALWASRPPPSSLLQALRFAF